MTDWDDISEGGLGGLGWRDIGEGDIEASIEPGS